MMEYERQTRSATVGCRWMGAIEMQWVYKCSGLSRRYDSFLRLLYRIVELKVGRYYLCKASIGKESIEGRFAHCTFHVNQSIELKSKQATNGVSLAKGRQTEEVVDCSPRAPLMRSQECHEQLVRVNYLSDHARFMLTILKLEAPGRCVKYLCNLCLQDRERLMESVHHNEHVILQFSYLLFCKLLSPNRPSPILIRKYD